jgi:hypothetical protein
LAAGKSAGEWRNGATTFTDQLDRATFCTVDLTDPVTPYVEQGQRAVAANRDGHGLSGAGHQPVRAGPGTGGKGHHHLKDQAGMIADLTAAQTEHALQSGKQRTRRAAGRRVMGCEDPAGQQGPRAWPGAVIESKAYPADSSPSGSA